MWCTGHVYEGTTDRTLHPAPDGVDPDLPLVVLMSGITREGGEQVRGELARLLSFEAFCT